MYFFGTTNMGNKSFLFNRSTYSLIIEIFKIQEKYPNFKLSMSDAIREIKLK